MSHSSNTTRFLYGTYPGRFLLKTIMHLRLDRIVVRYLCSPYSKPFIGWYAKHNGITLTNAEKNSFRTFKSFFERTRENVQIDMAPQHLISPCDGWLSVFPINEKSCFSIKNSYYRLKDILQDPELAKNYHNGTCLILRLCVNDYHHYCYIDNGYQGANHFIPGILHSVQPIACETVPVYALNKRNWCLLTTEHFGPVVQCEIGAMVVGGIFNRTENARFRKGSEKGHFELAGSTIVLLFEAGQMDLKADLLKKLSKNAEVQVKQGEWIGCGKRIEVTHGK